MKAEPSSRLTRPETWAWICAAVAVLVHLNALGNGFAYDDVTIIQENRALHDFGTLVRSLDQPYWPGHYGQDVGAWRPVITFLFGLEWIAFDGNPALFHLVGVLLHSMATGLVVLLLAHFLPIVAVAAGGLLFAVHPVHVEAVANLIGNTEVLATVFVLLSLLVHLKGGERYGWARAIAIGLLFALAMLTKELAVVLTALVFLVDAVRRDIGFGDLKEYLARRGRTYAVLVAVTLAVFQLRASVLGSVAPEQTPSGATLLEEVPRVWTLASSWAHYVRLLVWPADLAADYGGIIPVVVRWTPLAVTGVVAVLFLLGLGLWGWRTGGPMGRDRLSERALGFAVVWFGVCILPVSNIVFISPVLVAERNLYLPSVAVAIGVGYLLAVLVRERGKVGLAVTAALVVLGAGRTWDRNPDWQDTWSVFDDLMEHHPEAGRAWFFRGERYVMERNFPAARRAYAVAIGRMESHYSIATFVATRLSGMSPSHQRAAEFLLRRAWREKPEYYTAPGQLAALYLNQGRYAEGEEPARAAVALAPENPDIHRILAAILSGLGRPAEALGYRLEAMDLAEEIPWRWWLWISDDYVAVGDTAAALRALDSAKVYVDDPGLEPELDSLRRELVR